MSLPIEEKFINEDIFTKLNEEAAFLLGFIFTDGFLSYHKNTGLHYLRVYSKNRYKIENVKTIFSSSAKINHIRERSYSDVKQGELFYLHIGNETIIEDLFDLGMVEKKNQNIKFPYLPQNLYPHFLRGAWSGSGSIATYKKNISSKFTIGSIKFITDLEKHLNSISLSSQTIRKNKASRNPSYYIKYSIRDTQKLYKYLYCNATELTTDRKQEEKLSEYFSHREKNKPIKMPKRKMKRIRKNK